MKKWELIKQFIIENEPRRKDLNRFIKVNLNGYPEHKYTDAIGVGLYSINFQLWEYNGHIIRDKKGYRLSKLGKKTSLGFYQMIPEQKIKHLEDALLNNRRRSNELWHEKKELERDVENLEHDIAILKKANNNIIDFRETKRDDSLRDKFAMAALTGLVSNIIQHQTLRPEYRIAEFSGLAYRYADAMLRRKKK